MTNEVLEITSSHEAGETSLNNFLSVHNSLSNYHFCQSNVMYKGPVGIASQNNTQVMHDAVQGQPYLPSQHEKNWCPTKDNHSEFFQSNLLPVPKTTQIAIVRPVVTKRIRTQYTSHQLIELENEYQRNKYLCRPKRIHLAQTLDLSEKQIKVWFQNRRMKSKKESITKPIHHSNNKIIPSEYKAETDNGCANIAVENESVVGVTHRLLNYSVVTQKTHQDNVESASTFHVPTSCQWSYPLHPDVHQSASYNYSANQLESSTIYSVNDGFGNEPADLKQSFENNEYYSHDFMDDIRLMKSLSWPEDESVMDQAIAMGEM